MKLLFDQNLSPKLVARLIDYFPGSAHVQMEGLDRASDAEVWEHARVNGFAIVTKDDDFNELSVVRGSPPKVVWLRTGNCSTTRVESILREHAADLASFAENQEVDTLVLT